MYEPYPGIAQAQHLTIAEQLAAGIRYFDLRCRAATSDDHKFDIYHGAIDQNQTFDDVLATLYAFLDAHPHEAVIASVKEEAAESGATRSPFDQLFARYVAAAPDPLVPRAARPGARRCAWQARAPAALRHHRRAARHRCVAVGRQRLVPRSRTATRCCTSRTTTWSATTTRSGPRSPRTSRPSPDPTTLYPHVHERLPDDLRTPG